MQQKYKLIYIHNAIWVHIYLERHLDISETLDNMFTPTILCIAHLLIVHSNTLDLVFNQ